MDTRYRGVGLRVSRKRSAIAAAELALDVLRQARQGGHWPADWVTADAGYGEVPSSHDALAAEGWRYVVEVPSTLTVFTQAVQTAVPAWSGRGRQPNRTASK